MTPEKAFESYLGLYSSSSAGASEGMECIDIGEVEILSLSADFLHQLALDRNKHIRHTLIERLKEIRGDGLIWVDFTDPRYVFETKTKLPEFNEKHYGKVSNYDAKCFPEMARIYDLPSDEMAVSFLIPTLSPYINHYSNAIYRLDKDYTPDKEGWKNWISQRKLFSTRFLFSSINSCIPLDYFKKHAYIVGGTGSGKSELIKLIIHSQLKKKAIAENEWESGAIVIDPHGDLVQEIAQFNECQDSDRIIYFDPSLYGDKTPCIDIFNPPDYTEQTIDTMAQSITSAINEIIADSSISSQMKTLLIPCISVLLRMPKADLGDLQRFMLNEHNEDLIALGLASSNTGHAEFFKYGFSEKNFDVTKKSIYTRLQTLRNSTLFRMMLRPQATLNIEKELERGKIILFNLSKTTLGEDVSSAFGRLIVASLKNIGFRRQKIPKSKRKPSFIYIDECQNYIGTSIETTLTELRKYGIHIILANQVLGQNMSSQLVDIILSNTAVKFIGSNGDKTLRRMSTETGAKLEELKKLTVGKFYCKLNLSNKHTSPFQFKAPAYLVGSKNAMGFDEWRRQKIKGWVGYVKNGEKAEQAGLEKQPTKKKSKTPDFVDDEPKASTKKAIPRTKETKREKTTNNAPKFKL